MIQKPKPKYGWHGTTTSDGWQVGDKVVHYHMTDLLGSIEATGPSDQPDVWMVQWLKGLDRYALDYNHLYKQPGDTLLPESAYDPS